MKFDVIVVLAGGLTSKGLLPISVRERVRVASQLYKDGYAPIIIMSGKWSTYWDFFPPRVTEAQKMKEHALSLGVPEEKIWVEEFSHNTFENIFYIVKLYLEPRLMQRILFVTSDFHVPRVSQFLSFFSKTDFTFFCIGTHLDEGIILSLKRSTKEWLLLRSHWFFKKFDHRR